jgi:hypothetical protein
LTTEVLPWAQRCVSTKVKRLLSAFTEEFPFNVARTSSWQFKANFSLGKTMESGNESLLNVSRRSNVGGKDISLTT